jgi:hypothetical protein
VNAHSLTKTPFLLSFWGMTCQYKVFIIHVGEVCETSISWIIGAGNFYSDNCKHLIWLMSQTTWILHKNKICTLMELMTKKRNSSAPSSPSNMLFNSPHIVSLKVPLLFQWGFYFCNSKWERVDKMLCQGSLQTVRGGEHCVSNLQMIFPYWEGIH